ncbi:hypothetical protein CLAIMM_09606 [Cladophialophora immunda]|nr:hypothetical protein CLAIMM_09606 [Cladophialophora immunda]
MPSSWLEEEEEGGEQFQHRQSNNTHYSNEAQNPVRGAGSTYSAQVPNNGAFETYRTSSWGASYTQEPARAMATMVSQNQSPSQYQYQDQYQYPDDIDRSRWTEIQPANDLTYSPAFSDSPIISSTARRQTCSSDIDSLFEDTDDFDDEMLMPRRSLSESAADESPAGDLSRHEHDQDRPSPGGLSRQLQGQLNVSSSEAGVGPGEEVHAQGGDGIHPAAHGELSQIQLPGQESGYNTYEAATQSVSSPTEQLQAQERESETRPQAVHTCPCGCSTAECACHPSYCACLGCDHTEQARQLRHEAEKKWGIEGISGNQSCGCRDMQQRCSCLPGLCHCATCSEHGHAMAEPVKHCSCATGGQRCQCQPGRCACADCDEHTSGGEDFEAPAQPRANQDQAPESYSITDDAPPPQTQAWQQIGSGIGDQHTVTGVDATQACRCTLEGACSCPSGRCGCEKGSAAVGGRDLGGQHRGTAQSCLCREGQECTCCPAACSCRNAEPAPDQRTLHGPEETAGLIRAPTRAARQDHRPLHLKLEELIENPKPVPSPQGSAPIFSRKGSMLPIPAQPPTPAFSQQSSIPPSRPDTPRPPADSTPSTPYAADVLQDYVQQSIEPGLQPPSQEHIRQSVEPELPPPDWARESTPAYVDRSFTPSPFSRRDTDVEMRDASPTLLPGDFGRELSLPPPTSQPDPSLIGDYLAVRPVKPIPPPIPDGGSAIKQPKRGERRKSAVHGSKVEKRSATGSVAKPKSRNVTRKPTASVGKLVDKAKKKSKEAAAETAEGREEQSQGPGRGSQPATTTAAAEHGGKVAAAVAKIERQVKQQDQEKTLTQKDGTAVRRSRRANKGVRTSFGYT